MMKKCVYAVMSLLVIALLTAFFLPDHTEGKGEKRFFGAMSALFKREEAAKETDDGFSLKVYLTKDKKIKTIPLEEYVAGVVASEMPMTYHREALNAQAVAARSYAVFKSNLYSGEGCASHPGADVCSSSGCCQGYKPPDDDEYKNAIRAARETENAIALFRSHPIRALYHACSGGHTENAENVYTEALAYLRGVPSPGEEKHSRYKNTITLSITDLKEAFSAREDVKLLDDYPISQQIEILTRTETGRVKTIRVGLASMTGAEFRRLSGIGSAMFDIEFNDQASSATFLTRGYGHGVGMSQAGAQALASEGWDFQKIIRYYYSGVQIGSVESILREV